MIACHQPLLRAPDEPTLLVGICRLLVEQGGYRMAWVGFAEEDQAESVRPAAEFGFEARYLETLDITWAEDERGLGPTGTAIRSDRPVLARNSPADPAFAAWREEAVQRGCASCIALPLHDAGCRFGAIDLYSAEPDAFAAEEVDLLAVLADDLAYGIGALRQRAGRERAEEVVTRQSEQLQLLYEASQRLNSTLDLDDPHQAIYQLMSIVAPNQGLYMSAFDPETQLITCHACWMEDKWLDVGSFPPIPLEEEGKGTQSIVIRTGRSMLINDYQAQQRTAQSIYYVDSETSEVVDAIQVMSYRLNAYTEDQLRLTPTWARTWGPRAPARSRCTRVSSAKLQTAVIGADRSVDCGAESPSPGL